ncbi:hypothetical protein ABIE62_000352 [Porphyrobacter sp. MBR-155]|jgi:hypothetical protein|uniref:hypothetical protein n=1 Tax=Porphyrobacter sp. MBR-155 TaxID=3156464 RepID=UPI00339518C5
MTAQPDQHGGFVFYPDESFNGAVARWADETSLERMLDITRVAGVEWGHRQMASCADEAHIRELAAEMVVDAEELLGRSLPIIQDGAGSSRVHRFGGLSVSTALLEKRIRRVSPRALQIAPYHRALWDLRLFPCCLETGDVLISACDNPECNGRPLGWRHTRGIDVCDHCMGDLKQVRTPQIAPELVTKLRTIAQLFDLKQRPKLLATLPPGIAAKEGQVAFDLLNRLLPVVDPDLKNLWARLHRADAFKLAQALDAAWELMAGWPDSFEAFASERIADREAIHLDGNEGETVRFLTGKRLDEASSEVADLARDLREKMEGDGKNAEGASQRALAIKPTARLLSLGTAEVAQLRRDGILRIMPVIDKQGRLQPMFCRREVEEIAEGIATRMGVDRVASQFGISRHGAEQLADWGHLAPLDHPFFLARYGIRQVDRASAERFLQDLEQAQANDPLATEVSLSIAIKIVGASLKPWGHMFSKLSDGSIPFRLEAGDAPLVRRIFIRREDVAQIPDLERPASMSETQISKGDAYEILNLGPKEGTQLFTDTQSEKGGRAKLLSVKTVLEMARRHISSMELALRRGVSTQRAYNDALKAGVPLLSPAGFCRQSAEAVFLTSSN